MTTESRLGFDATLAGHVVAAPAPVASGDRVVPFVQAVTSAFIVRALGTIPARTHTGGGWTLDALARGPSLKRL